MVIDEKIDKIILLKEMVIRNKNLCIINEKNINDNYCEHWFTIGNSKANKGTGAIDISNYLNIPLKNVISIGNDYNDLPMFKKSGISFAVENADTFIKNNASLVVSSNNDSGVSQAIDYIYKNNGD